MGYVPPASAATTRCHHRWAGGRSSSEQAWTGLQGWPLGVTSMGVWVYPRWGVVYHRREGGGYTSSHVFVGRGGIAGRMSVLGTPYDVIYLIMHVMLPTPSLRGETHACENIICPKLLLRPVIMSTFFPFFATWMSVGTSLMGDKCNNMETEIYFWGSGLFLGRRFVAEAQVCFWGAGLFLRHRSVSEAQVCFWVGCLFLRRRSFSEAWI